MKQKVNIATIKPNETNPRYIKDSKFKKLLKSIKEFPEMLEKRPIVVDENMVILGGNMRYEACKAAGIFEVWIDVAEGWTEEQKIEFIVKDNVGFGEWDWDILGNDWQAEQLEDWGLDIPFFDQGDIEDQPEEKEETKSYKIEVTLETELEQDKLNKQLIADGYKARIL
jgi:ParB-like chromosome segregation protein Spo0J